jgi:hypothetical protein
MILQRDIKAIERKDRTYYLYFETTELKRLSYATPTYTGHLKANGVVARSKVFKRVTSVEKIVHSTERVQVDESTAQKFYAVNMNNLFNLEKEDKRHWVARFD